jgi:hypothetical protein
MADFPSYQERDQDADAGPERESGARSRWTKVLLVVFALLFLAVIVLHLLTGGLGNH